MSQINLTLNNLNTEVIISWSDLTNEIDLINFLESEFLDLEITNKKTSVPLGIFLASKKNFVRYIQLNGEYRGITSLSPELINSIKDIPTYKAAIGDFQFYDENLIQPKLTELGFKRELQWFQKRNLSKMLGYPSIADFSVPGSGKTTEAIAFYLLKRNSINDKVLIISPINAFTAWEEDVPACIEGESVLRLRGEISDIKKLVKKQNKFLITNYEFVRSSTKFLEFLAEELRKTDRNYFIVLDESHRMKGQQTAQILSYLAPLSKNKIILTGTPMPQSTADLVPQFNFLFPDEPVFDNESLIEKFKPIFVRTTKKEMNRESITLPPIKETVKKVSMLPHQKEFYHILIDRMRLRKYDFRSRQQIKDFKRAYMRLLQVSSNPLLQLDYISKIDKKLAEKITQEGIGSKMKQVIADADNLANKGEKVIIWSSFPKNIKWLKIKLRHHNAVNIDGSVPSGKKDELGTRENAIHQFKTNEFCKVFIANPMAAGEGISLQKCCRKALYLDRTYNLAQYLQSKDRIHRIGGDVSKDVEIDIYKLTDSVDEDVHSRLELKLERMSKFLNDPSILSNFESLDADDDEDDWSKNDLQSAIAFLNL